jgi:hypothetical protein
MVVHGHDSRSAFDTIVFFDTGFRLKEILTKKEVSGNPHIALGRHKSQQRKWLQIIQYIACFLLSDSAQFRKSSCIFCIYQIVVG